MPSSPVRYTELTAALEGLQDIKPYIGVYHLSISYYEITLEGF